VKGDIESVHVEGNGLWEYCGAAHEESRRLRLRFWRRPYFLLWRAPWRSLGFFGFDAGGAGARVAAFVKARVVRLVVLGVLFFAAVNLLAP